MSSIKENRKIANFYGGKALTGTAKQKEWAEEIRATVLNCSLLSDEEKTAFVVVGKLVQTAKFWINNKDIDPKYFTEQNIVREVNALNDVRDRHYDVLASSGPTGPKDSARKEIVAVLTANQFQLGAGFSFPNFDPYNCWGVFEK